MVDVCELSMNAALGRKTNGSHLRVDDSSELLGDAVLSRCPHCGDSEA